MARPINMYNKNTLHVRTKFHVATTPPKVNSSCPGNTGKA